MLCLSPRATRDTHTSTCCRAHSCVRASASGPPVNPSPLPLPAVRNTYNQRSQFRTSDKQTNRQSGKEGGVCLRAAKPIRRVTKRRPLRSVLSHASPHGLRIIENGLKRNIPHQRATPSSCKLLPHRSPDSKKTPDGMHLTASNHSNHSRTQLHSSCTPEVCAPRTCFSFRTKLPHRKVKRQT